MDSTCKAPCPLAHRIGSICIAPCLQALRMDSICIAPCPQALYVLKYGSISIAPGLALGKASYHYDTSLRSLQLFLLKYRKL